MSAMRFLVFMLLSCGVYATENTWYVGVYITTDFAFRSCTPYDNQTLKEYLEAFVGGVNLYFKDQKSPAIEIVYLGSRDLTGDEERKIIGSVESGTEIAVKGGDALKHMMNIPLEGDDEEGILGNKLLLVLTGLNITEEETKTRVNSVPHAPGSSGVDGGDYDSVDSHENRMVHARAASKNKFFKNVGGLSQYGSMCFMCGAIVQDYGSNFSGIAAAAEQVANVLGPMYKGRMARRKCSENDLGQETFHSGQCATILSQSVTAERFDCLEEPLEDGKMDLMTPHQFYEKHSSWTPCRASYQETQECGKPREESYPHKDCSISCCLASSFSFLKSSYPIPAPDGEKCESEKICLGGKCVPETQHK